MPITWGGIHQLHASLFYTIEALNLDKSTHTAVFVAIHKEGNFLSNPKAIQDFLEKFGVIPEKIKGGYVYTKYNQRIHLSGFNKGESIILTERHSSKVTGHFNSSIQEDGSIQGIWTNPDKTKSLPFILQKK